MHAWKMKHRLGRETPVSENSEHVSVTYEQCTHVTGPFFHGTKVALGIGEELAPGYRSNN